LVPVLVRQHDSNEAIFSLGSQDFTVTDDGVPQKVRLQEDPKLSRSPSSSSPDPDNPLAF
jgi:hypothetical protein